jgi:hypothetical protein
MKFEDLEEDTQNEVKSICGHYYEVHVMALVKSIEFWYLTLYLGSSLSLRNTHNRTDSLVLSLKPPYILN